MTYVTLSYGFSIAENLDPLLYLCLEHFFRASSWERESVFYDGSILLLQKSPSGGLSAGLSWLVMGWKGLRTGDIWLCKKGGAGI